MRISCHYVDCSDVLQTLYSTSEIIHKIYTVYDIFHVLYMYLSLVPLYISTYDSHPLEKVGLEYTWMPNITPSMFQHHSILLGALNGMQTVHCHFESLHPWRLTWNIIKEVWKIIFVSKRGIGRFHVNLPGCGETLNIFRKWVMFKWESSGYLREVIHIYILFVADTWHPEKIDIKIGE